MSEHDEVELWGVHEIVLHGPSDGDPFTDVDLQVDYRYRNRVVTVDGFYDGDGVYRARFMPDRRGEWSFVTRSNVASLDGQRGAFTCVAPDGASKTNHGPVRVAGRHHFAYADGERYPCLGTTCYHWTYEPHEVQELTLRSLEHAPFDKVRMCVLPTDRMRPERIPFAGTEPGQVDVSRFDPAFFRHFESRIADLCAIGVQADVILFHPYDNGVWGFDRMTPEQDEHYLRYVIARLGAYRNVWWSMANEFDFNHHKTVADWDRLLQFVQRHDPYQRLRSIHNGTKMYEIFTEFDFAKTWVTHQSVQHWDGSQVATWRERVAKPVVVDEIGYEGDIDRRWGNLSGAEMTHRFWQGTTLGGYIGHGEAFADRETRAWISGGGRLYGDSMARIAFLRDFLAALPRDPAGEVDAAECVLHYVGDRQPASLTLDLPPGASYRVEVVDTWQMQVTPVTGEHRGRSRIPLPRRPYLAVVARRNS